MGEKPVLIGFCEEKSPSYGALENLARDFSARYKFCAVDLSRERELARQFHILSAPALILMEQGKISQRIREIPDSPTLERMLG